MRWPMHTTTIHNCIQYTPLTAVLAVLNAYFATTRLPTQLRMVSLAPTVFADKMDWCPIALPAKRAATPPNRIVDYL